MEATFTEASYAAGVIFGIMIGIFGAALGVMGGIDYFYQSKSRFNLLKIFTFISIFFSATLVVVGIVCLACGEVLMFLYGTALPGALGLILFIMIHTIILRRFRFIEYKRTNPEYHI